MTSLLSSWTMIVSTNLSKKPLLKGVVQPEADALKQLLVSFLTSSL